jgi:hypothetical protein
MNIPSWRKPFGAFLIIFIIIIWAGLVVMASPLIEQLPALAQAIVYVAAGMVWIMPLKPLLAWMEAGVTPGHQR